jgi:hypothetical protein
MKAFRPSARLFLSLISLLLALPLVPTPASAQSHVLTLADAVRLALRKSPVLQAASSGLDAARGREGQAMSGWLPTVVGVASYNRQTGNYTPRPGATPTTVTSGTLSNSNTSYDVFNFGLSLQQTVWDFGRTLGQHRRARAGVDAARSDLADVRLAVAGLVEITAIASGYDHNLCIGPLVRSATSLYAPSRTGLITTTVALKAYLKRTTDNAWLAGKTVAFSVAGSSVGSAATDAGGQATLNYVIATSAGTHTIGVSYAGDASYQPCATSAALTATTTNTKVYVVDRTAKVKTYTVLKSYLYTPTNAIIPGKPMVLKLDGTTLASGNTNTSGYLQVGYTVAEGAGVGVRTIRGEFPGDGGYMASANTGKLTVTAGDLYIWPYVRSGKRGTNHLLKAYVRSLPDYVIQPGKSITFKVNGSEIGTSAVGSDGWASATWAIPADEPTGAHTAAAEFAGDAWYKAVTANTPFNVVL